MFWPSKKMHVLEEPVPEARMRIAPSSNAYEQLRAGTGSAVCLPSAAKLSP